ncbi:hypothetical protein [Pedobacter foliorum]|uniref:hypothetical protein n=1 Tax=Pedobacter foliorum TaxID=2739058 RepID=UPI001565D9A9|nr:hypothetical protein [Pedobacter foliorum]NRF37760.1 hypothetical protein [Pedobacter foliorum]
MRTIILLLAICLTTFSSCNNASTFQDIEVKQPHEGELSQEFENSKSPDTTMASPQQPVSEEDRLGSEGWKTSDLSNGAMPDCYNYRPRYGELNNKLVVTVGGGTAVVIKMMSISSNRCIRYVFINSGSTYAIKNLPEDQYYLKIAYGKKWISKAEDGKCLGKFMSNALYEKGEDILDFNRQKVATGYNIPSFSLELDVISNSSVDSFNSSGITEDDFNN